MKRFVLMAVLVVLALGLRAQQDYTMYNMRYLQQSSFINPAFAPECKVNIGIPGLSGLYGRASWSGFTLNELVTLDANDSLELTFDNALSSMATRNYFETETRVDALHFGFTVGEFGYLSFNVSGRSLTRLVLTDDLFRFAWEGNGRSFLGERVSLDGTGLDAWAYVEYAAAYTKSFNENFTFGTRVKFLQGIANIHTRQSEIGFTTDALDYDLMVDGNFELQTSGVADTTIDGPSFNFDNTGFGIDIGAAYQFAEKLELSASLVDVGYITWREGNRNYVLEDENIEFSGFSGFSGTLTTNPDNPNVAVDSVENTLEQLQDSISEQFDPDENAEEYTTLTPGRFFFGARYTITDRMYFGGLTSLTLVKGRVRPAFSFSYNYRLRRLLGIAVSYSIYNRSFANVGLGFAINAGPVQWHLLFDNVLAPVMPQNLKNLHARTGFNLNFGCKKPRKKRPGF